MEFKRYARVLKDVCDVDSKNVASILNGAGFAINDITRFDCFVLVCLSLLPKVTDTVTLYYQCARKCVFC